MTHWLPIVLLFLGLQAFAASVVAEDMLSVQDDFTDLDAAEWSGLYQLETWARPGSQADGSLEQTREGLMLTASASSDGQPDGGFALARAVRISPGVVFADPPTATLTVHLAEAPTFRGKEEAGAPVLLGWMPKGSGVSVVWAQLGFVDSEDARKRGLHVAMKTCFGSDEITLAERTVRDIKRLNHQPLTLTIADGEAQVSLGRRELLKELASLGELSGAGQTLHPFFEIRKAFGQTTRRLVAAGLEIEYPQEEGDAAAAGTVALDSQLASRALEDTGLFLPAEQLTAALGDAHAIPRICSATTPT